MIPPKISVITPSFNQGKYLEETIISVINQNYPNLEYIIIDGGSTDNSVEIIRKYENYLTYWVSEKDNGQSNAINKGFKKSTGEIICWLNSDDIFTKNALFEIVKYFEKNEGIDVVNGNLVLINEHSNIISSYFMITPKKWYAKHGIYYVAQPAMFWKRKVLDKVGLLREDFHASMDRDFLIRIMQNNFSIGHLKKNIAGFRMHEASKSSAGSRSKDYLRDLKELRKLYGSEYGGSPKKIFKFIYRLEKLIKGVYFNKWIFTIRWKGKCVKDLD